MALGDPWSIDVRTGAMTNLSSTPDVSEYSPIWSSDGRLLALAGIPTSWHSSS
ncbi:hypothetical protein AB0J83_21240 [Actinoplanes sp. NPDC049596]|uniref:hypothetical protein n=1 Tax=unclassified Actinoplanes TaxID=2626549 RepID=UPI00342B7431